jgi:hypothetical protein
MLREQKVQLFDFLAGQAKAFNKADALAGAVLFAHPSILAAVLFFLGQHRRYSGVC